MPDTQGHDMPAGSVMPLSVHERRPLPETWTSQLDALLEELQELTQAVPVAPIVDREIDNRLIQVRLGIASSLFTALRYKHPTTAAHSLRVALGCSAWCVRLGVDSEQRDKIEIAALLHDLGTIGIPDRILQKPGLLDVDEATIIERSRHMSVEILRSCCAEPDILSIVENVPARYDGTRAGYRVVGDEIPFGARMIAIVESFDSMTNEQVFRPAMSREAAMNELFACASSQFDPEMVNQFADFCGCDQIAARHETSHRWLQTLDPRAIERYWRLHHSPVPSGQLDRKRIFETRLLDNMYDAVIFVDTQMTIQLWNSGSERMTGILSKTVCHQQWQPELLNLRDEKGEVIESDECPVLCSMRSGVQSLRRLVIWGRNGRPISVDTHVIPVMDEAGKTLGAVLVLHDASSEISLERRCQSLHDEAITDPLTRVANRAEFDRVHDMFVKAHSQRRLPCSLIICDLDRFKQVNDVYGHQAGDDVIQTLASLLKDSCRSGDLVARYGGEEFVMLYTDCDNATAARRAEEVRFAMSRIPHRRMGGRGVTASFGVTEIQPGDTPETMLRRADRALLMAKSRGRNMVVQLGTGSMAGTRSLENEVPMPLAHVGQDGTRIEHDLFTSVPIAVAIEKLRGFIADHRARILEADHNRLRLQIEHTATGPRRRRGDRVMSFYMELELDEGLADDAFEGAEPGAIPAGRMVSGTRVHAVISPASKRDRRADDVIRRSREVLLSLRSYLMAIHGQTDGVVEDGILAEDDRSKNEVDLSQLQTLRRRSVAQWLRQVIFRRPTRANG